MCISVFALVTCLCLPVNTVSLEQVRVSWFWCHDSIGSTWTFWSLLVASTGRFAMTSFEDVTVCLLQAALTHCLSRGLALSFPEVTKYALLSMPKACLCEEGGVTSGHDFVTSSVRWAMCWALSPCASSHHLSFRHKRGFDVWAVAFHSLTNGPLLKMSRIQDSNEKVKR